MPNFTPISAMIRVYIGPQKLKILLSFGTWMPLPIFTKFAVCRLFQAASLFKICMESLERLQSYRAFS